MWITTYVVLFQVHKLSCEEQGPMVRTLSRSHAMSIKLESNKDDERNHNHCCADQTKEKYIEQRRTVVGPTIKSSLKDEQATLHKNPNVESRSAPILESSKGSLSSPSMPVEQQITASVHPSCTVGEKVMVDTPNGFKFGKVKFVGSTEFAPGELIGVALERPTGELLRGQLAVWYCCHIRIP